MTILDDDLDLEPWRDEEPSQDLEPTRGQEGSRTAREPEGDEREPLDRRTLVAAALASAGAGLVAGGIFGSTGARLLGALAAVGGVAWNAVVVRSRRQSAMQLLFAPLALAAGAVTVLLGGESPAEIPDLVRDAVDAGRLLSPPVPFDVGWRPLLVLLFALLGYGAGWIGAVLGKPIGAVALPLPIIGLTAITQPDDAQFLAGLLAFAPLAAALAVLFSTGGGAGLTREFELKRALRAGAGGIVVVVALVAMQQVTFLFPEPAYDPTDQPQKPRAVPLSEATDRVLLSVDAPPGFTGPWRTGALDIYDGAWKLPGGTASRLVPIPADGIVDRNRLDVPEPLTITVRTGDLGTSPVLPVVPTANHLRVDGLDNGRLDPRTGTVRVTEGRVPSGLTYAMTLPPYPSATELSQAGPLTGASSGLDDLLEVPAAPRAIRNVLNAAPPSGWARLDHVRHQLLDNVTATGPGTPVDTPPKLVEDLLVGSKKGTPFEIVAAQVLLARWAGFPARIGFGFNGGVEGPGGVLEVRPKHAAQWLEVHLDGYGWVPLLDVPPQAEASLDNPDDADSNIKASEDISVAVLVPVEVRDPRLLFEIVRARILQVLPLVSLVLLAWLASPWAARAIRSRRRLEWATELGPRARVGVAYAELRDVATDLGVGDPFATPIEYLGRVVEDDEHVQLAWVVSRTMYGDLALTVTDADADAAEEMARSLRQRLWRAQPLQTRALALVSRASLAAPYSDEAPNVRLPRPLAATRTAIGRVLRRVRVPRPRLKLPRRRTA